jgi:hypothetical protein
MMLFDIEPKKVAFIDDLFKNWLAKHIVFHDERKHASKIENDNLRSTLR